MLKLPHNLPTLPEIINDLPNISGWETEVLSVVNHDQAVFLPTTNLKLADIDAVFAIALHMHQPTIPAGHSNSLISNLQYMFEHQHEGDNHNAKPFAYCYSRMGDLIPELVNQGCNPRVMLDYSGNLLWGLRQMGRSDILDNLKRITCDTTYQPYVEWLGTMLSHAVIPSTPIADMKLHIIAWQHHFAAIFGWEALGRVKGFSPPEMHLPNHPDILFGFIKALKESGYLWLLVQEHTIETITGESITQKHLPHRLVARNSQGETISITTLIKTQGADTKLVAQMQPYYEAKTLSKQQLASNLVPPIVSQIGDGENGGVMMNEFPNGFKQAWWDMVQHGGGKTRVVAVCGTEYLELLADAGYLPEDFPPCQPVGQHQIWQQIPADNFSPNAVENAIQGIIKTNPNFHVDGASWTNHISWVQGYENVLSPMYELSNSFHRKFDHFLANNSGEAITKKTYYRRNLLYNLLLQTSCFPYWGQGTWTDYAREIYKGGQKLSRCFVH
jgi:hypothetical protein